MHPERVEREVPQSDHRTKIIEELATPKPEDRKNMVQMFLDVVNSVPETKLRLFEVLSHQMPNETTYDLIQNIAHFWKDLLGMALNHYPEGWDFTTLIEHPIYQRLFQLELDFWKYLGHSNTYQFVTEIILRHAHLGWMHFGRKSYQISPGLRWRLENTELRNYPADELRLPHNVVYIELPPTYHLVNDITGDHVSEGAYIVADHLAEPRRWRVILIGRDNENSRYEGDDALYHWNIRLREGKTVEECLQESQDITDATMGNNDLAHYEQMKPTLDKLFPYLMNVILYATMSEADLMIVQSDPEYSKLFNRAMKLDKKSKKRRSLLARAKQLDSQPRILLGGSIVVDRSKDGTGGDSEGSKGKVTVRTLVSGHWRNQPVGEGRKERKRIWIEPHWRGPEYAPITSRTHVLKSEGT